MNGTDPLLHRAHAGADHPRLSGRHLPSMAEDASSEDVFWSAQHVRGIILPDGFIARLAQPQEDAPHLRLLAGPPASTPISTASSRLRHRPAPPTATDLINPAIRRSTASSSSAASATPSRSGRTASCRRPLRPRHRRGLLFGRACSIAAPCQQVALAHLVERLRAGGYRLLDTQFVTDHLKTFGGIEIPREDYPRAAPADAIRHGADFHALDTPA